MVGFFRQQQERMAMRLIVWQLQRTNAAPPPPADLEQMARKLVDDAHQIAKKRGSNVMNILKELVQDIRK